MSRVARDIISDIPYHIIHRGNNRQKIFFSEADCSYFISLMREAKKKHPCKIYSYVLMPNHIHLLLETFQSSENIAKFIKLLAQKHAQHINKSQKRTGTLWEGRFKSSPISKDNYLLACTRYIEFNPVRAGIVKEPGNYKWSSYRFKAGDNDSYQLLDKDPMYLDLGKEDAQRQVNYKKWFKENIPSEEWNLIRKAVNKSGVFGNVQFKEEMEKLSGRSFNVREKGRPKNNIK